MYLRLLGTPPPDLFPYRGQSTLSGYSSLRKTEHLQPRTFVGRDRVPGCRCGDAPYSPSGVRWRSQKMLATQPRPLPLGGEGVIRCQRCGRLLTNPQSQDRGYGPVCWRKVQAMRELLGVSNLSTPSLTTRPFQTPHQIMPAPGIQCTLDRFLWGKAPPQGEPLLGPNPFQIPAQNLLGVAGGVV